VTGEGGVIPSTQRYYRSFFFYYLLLLKLLHVSVVRPSSGRNIFARIHSTDNGSVVFTIQLTVNSCQSSKVKVKK
jgi:hypothetical protein